MTRKHFDALASALASQMPAPHWDANKRAQWQLDCKAIAMACMASNQNFNFERFYRACGMTDVAKAA